MRTFITVFAVLAAVFGFMVMFGLFVVGPSVWGVPLAIAACAPAGALLYMRHRQVHDPFERELNAVKALRLAPPPTFTSMLSPECAVQPPADRARRSDAPSAHHAQDAEPPPLSQPDVPDDDRPTPARTMLPPPLSPEARRSMMKLVHTDGRRLTPKQIRRRPPKW